MFVHGQNGLFMSSGGAEYVMIICALSLALAARRVPAAAASTAGCAHRQRQRDRELAHITDAPVTVADPTTTAAHALTPAVQQEPVTYRFAAQPPVVLPPPFAPGPDEVTAHVPAPNSSEHSGPLPVRRSRAAHASR